MPKLPKPSVLTNCNIFLTLYPAMILLIFFTVSAQLVLRVSCQKVIKKEGFLFPSNFLLKGVIVEVPSAKAKRGIAASYRLKENLNNDQSITCLGMIPLHAGRGSSFFKTNVVPGSSTQDVIQTSF